MGIRIIESASYDEAVLYDSTAMWAFGPVFDCEYDAQSFLRWAAEAKDTDDVRRLADGALQAFYAEWLKIDWSTYDPDARERHAPFEATI